MQVDLTYAALFVAASCVTTWLVARGIGRVNVDRNDSPPPGKAWERATRTSIDFGSNLLGVEPPTYVEPPKRMEPRK